jgi:uncharacterized lipoprotein YajG
MTTTGSPRRRPHPARRARVAAGYTSIAAMLMLTGCIAATTKTSTATPSAAAATQASSTATQSTSATTTTATDRSASVAAVAAPASDQATTSSHAS